MKVTLEYIARMANVSKATVSRVINNRSDGVGAQTRARVQKILDEYDYKNPQPTKVLARSKSKTIGLVIPDITNSFFAELVKAVDDYLSARGYVLLLCNTNSSAIKENNCISVLAAQKVDGVILVSTVGEQINGCEQLKKYNIPCVLMDRKMKTSNYSASVYIDNEYAMFIAADYLIKQGNRDIALFLGQSYLSASIERLEGYKSALKHHGIAYERDLVIWGEFTYDSGYNAMLYLQQSGRAYTAVLAACDVIALGALKALSYLRLRVPEDIRVIGFDNIALSEMVDPPLSTLEQPIKELGTKAAQVLLEAIDTGAVRTPNIRLEAKLILRKST